LKLIVTENSLDDIVFVCYTAFYTGVQNHTKYITIDKGWQRPLCPTLLLCIWTAL